MHSILRQQEAQFVAVGGCGCPYVLFHSMYYSQQTIDDADLLQSDSLTLPL